MIYRVKVLTTVLIEANSAKEAEDDYYNNLGFSKEETFIEIVPCKLVPVE